jgi:hypothetical protein
LKLLDKFKGLASVHVKDGVSYLFWDDCWMGQPLKLSFPELFSFVKKTSYLTQFSDISGFSNKSLQSPFVSASFCSVSGIAGSSSGFSPQ